MTTFSRSRQRRLLPASLMLAALTQTMPVLAQGQGQDEAAARALFNDGRQLVKAGHYEEACSKFEAARKFYVSSGLLLNLADCHEHVNRTASAWAEFGAAAFSAATSGRPKDEAEAKRRQSALEGRLMRLAIRVKTPSPDEVVKRDGVVIDRAVWETAVPVDPGVHTIIAEGPGRATWSKSVEVNEPGKTATVEIPELAVSETPKPSDVATKEGNGSGEPNPDEVAAARAGATRRVIGLAVGGVGIVALGTGGVLGLMAKSKYATAQDATTSRHADSVSAGHLADAATVAIVVGVAATAAGAVLWFTAPKAPVAVGANLNGIVLSGNFQ